MKGFNLSDWALSHRSMVWYFMLVFVVAGVFSYLNLGREEDPNFTIKTMIIQANWPGASVDVRPTAVALVPCGLAASGARDLPSTEPPAEPSPTGSSSVADVEPAIDDVDPVADDAMLGIGMSAPRSQRRRPQRKRRHDSPWSGVQAPCPVYVRSSDRPDASAQLNAAHTTHRIK